MKVTVIGSGYVGTTTALLLAEHGHEVIGFDVDEMKVRKLSSGSLPFNEPGLQDLLVELLSGGRIRFTSEPAFAVKQSELLMIAVGTPSASDGKADLTYVRSVLQSITAHADGPKIVVTKSTVPVGTNRWMQEWLSRECPHKIAVVSNPEFLREGTALYDSRHPSRTVIGGEDAEAMALVKELYAVLPTHFYLCNFETAELIKYASNGFLAAKISYINEIARLAEQVGADIKGVAAGMGMDPRISPYHLYAGIGYGGSCFPKDVDELLYSGRQHRVPLRILEQAKHINDTQIDWFVRKASQVLPLQGKRMLVLGIAFKEDTDDQRESPGIKLIEHLLELGAAEIRIMDPTVSDMGQIRWIRGVKDEDREKLSIAAHQAAAADGIHAVWLTTTWPQYLDCPWREWAKRADTPFLFDGRNYLDPVQMRTYGWKYFGVARGAES